MINTVSNLFYQLQQTLITLGSEQYQQRVALVQGASIGQHIRHIIELYQELISGYDSGIVDYEKRKRNLLLETDKELAIRALNQLVDELVVPDKPLMLNSDFSNLGGNAIVVQTNFERELLYNIEHTIHHMAIIRIAVEAEMKIQVPESFGLAPSTIKYRQQCAQ